MFSALKHEYLLHKCINNARDKIIIVRLLTYDILVIDLGNSIFGKKKSICKTYHTNESFTPKLSEIIIYKENINCIK